MAIFVKTDLLEKWGQVIPSRTGVKVTKGPSCAAQRENESKSDYQYNNPLSCMEAKQCIQSTHYIVSVNLSVHGLCCLCYSSTLLSLLLTSRRPLILSDGQPWTTYCQCMVSHQS